MCLELGDSISEPDMQKAGICTVLCSRTKPLRLSECVVKIYFSNAAE